jgi:two-component system phosphate regulon sensor histidine kinase PhoR
MSRLGLTMAAAVVLLAAVCALLATVSVVVALIVALVGGVAFALYFGQRVLSTPRSVQAAAAAIAEGQYGVRVAQRGPAELVQLTDSFNLMAQRLQARMASADEGRNRLMAALDSSLDPILALDAEGRIVFANLATQRLFERDAQSMTGDPISWLLPDERVIEAVRATRERGQQSATDIERPARRFYRVLTSPIAGGGEWSVLVVIHDESDRRRTDQMRRDFVANVSHELRTPLAGIKAVIETLADGAIEDREAAEDFLARADAEIDRLIVLVEELIELSRIESGDVPLSITPANVYDLLSQLVSRIRPQAERKNLFLALEAGEDLVADLDRGRFESAVLNLLQNAVNFTPEGGNISVGAERRDGELLVRVQDSGAGIDPAAVPRLFERFYKADASRASGAGSGIGLAIVKHAIEAHGGRVEVQSRLGEGSTFTLIIPLVGRDRAADLPAVNPP